MGNVVTLFDIETYPAEGLFYNRLYEANIIKVNKPEFLLSFAWKTNDEKVKVLGLDDMPGYKPGSTDDSKLVKKLWELFDRSDILIGQNSDQFDIKWANTRFIALGLPPPSPYKTYDTLKISRKYFKFLSNKLDYLSKELVGAGKVVHEGFPLWEGCRNGIRAYWKRLKHYNKVDVVRLYEVWSREMPWVLQNKAVFEGRECPECQSTKTQSRGIHVNRSGRWKRHQCQECGYFFLGDKLIKRLWINKEQSVKYGLG